MNLRMVTFTGADDSTDIGKLIDISEAHPWVEWGILLPPNDHGMRSNRFPSHEWLAEFVGCARVSHHKVRIAGHICPWWTKPFLTGELDEDEALVSAFDRIQINTHGEEHTFNPAVMRRMALDHARQYILQRDGANEQMAFNMHTEHNITGLFDLSHGAGVVPDSWPSPPYWQGSWIGYAGGLGPDNVREELPKIAHAAEDHPFWIDMETKVRTSGKFDLHKVNAVIEQVSEFVQK